MPRVGSSVPVATMGALHPACSAWTRSNVAVSYTIANLEMQLGIALFDRERTRKRVLTEASASPRSSQSARN
jgi:hypothetical protein